jgi:uncharacterized membrane-anchored protein
VSKFDAGGGLRSQPARPRRYVSESGDFTHTPEVGRPHTEEEEDRLRTVKILAIVTALVSLAVVFALGAIGVWLTSDATVFGLVVLAAGTVAGLLVVYFEWRQQLYRRFTADALEGRHAA